MKKNRVVFLSIIMALLVCLSISVIGAEYAKITSMEGSSEKEANNPPTAIIDGDEVTRWGNMGADDYADITFEKEETIESIDLMFFKAPEREHVISVESSADGKTWTAVSMAKDTGVADGSLQPADRPDFATEGGYWDNFPLTTPVTAKYWRITFLGRAESGSLDTGSPISLWEVRFVLGQAAAPVEEAAPVQEAAPVEEAAPVQEAAPVEEAAPVQEVAPVEEAAPVADSAPVIDEPAAPSATPSAVTSSAPQTGDATTFIIIICVVAAFAFMVISRRKVNSK